MRVKEKWVLVADDDHHARFLLCSLLDHAGYHVVPACDGLAALQELTKRPFDVLITDYRMPVMNGLELLKRTRALHPRLPVILVSGAMPDDISVSDCGPFVCLPKPYDNARLLEVLRCATAELSAGKKPVLSSEVRPSLTDTG
ncbi:MAG TPA: response regulator [Nitrospira sp.]|nr:response regulator [Nitrospira sp.]